MTVELSQKAAEIEQKFNSLTESWGMYQSTLGNNYGYNEVISKIGCVRNDIAGFIPSSDFERLWAGNVIHQTDVQEALIHHYRGEPKMTVPELLDTACGPGTYSLIESSFINYDHEGMWKAAELEAKREKLAIPTNTRQAQEAIEPLRPEIIGEVKRFGIENGYLPQGFDFQQDFGLPGTYGRPFWNPQRKSYFLGYDSFQCFDEGGLRVNSVQIYAVTFHEILGHASHQIHSEKLPESLQLSNESGNNTPNRVVAEGIAMNREKMAYEWMRQNADRLKLNATDIDLSEKRLDAYSLLVDPTIIVGILKEREHFEGLNLREYVRQLQGNSRTVFRFSDPQGSGFRHNIYPIERAIFELVYPAGFKTVDNVMRKFGPVNDRKALNKAQTTGVWGWKTYPDAVDYFLKNPI